MKQKFTQALKCALINEKSKRNRTVFVKLAQIIYRFAKISTKQVLALLVPDEASFSHQRKALSQRLMIALAGSKPHKTIFYTTVMEVNIPWAY